MLLKSLLFTLLICVPFAIPTFADTFAWSYNVPGIDASGTFVTAPFSDGSYAILQITGQRNGDAITGLSNFGSANNLLYPTFPYFDILGLAYVAGGTAYNLYGTTEIFPNGFVNHLLIDAYISFDPTRHQVDTEVRMFSLTRIGTVPEPSSIVLMCTGLALLGRRLKTIASKSH
jgi:hypothetical protein